MPLVSDRIDGSSDGHLLVTALRGGPLAKPRGTDKLRGVTQAADYHGIVIPLFRSFARDNREFIETTELGELARGRRAGALKITAAAVDACTWLTQAGVRYAILKGPAIALAYEEADREFVDLDVLVAPNQMLSAIATLEEHGARRLEAVQWPRDDGIGELPFLLPSGVTLDLHGDLVHHADVRRTFRLPAEPLLARATPARILGNDLFVLDPEDNFIHVALHAMISGGDRLVWMADLRALAGQGRISWPTLVDRARDARAGLVVGVMLERSIQVVGTQVPKGVLRELQRRGMLWAAAIRLFEHLRPTAANYGHSLHGQVLMRATRDSSFSSLGTLLRIVWSDVVCFVLRDPQHPWRIRFRQWRHRR
jgi:hypothetical protein